MKTMRSVDASSPTDIKNIYSESRVSNFDDYVKKKDRFRHTLLHWHQIPRANNPKKPLQNNVSTGQCRAQLELR